MTAFLSILLLGAAPAIAPVTQVVMYPDRAQVTRAAEVNCKGVTPVRFEGIPPAADPSSLRASATGAAAMGLRVEEVVRKEAFAPEVEKLDAELRKLDGERAALQDALSENAGQRSLAEHYLETAIQMVNHEMVDAAANSKSWNQAFETALATRRATDGDDVDLAAKIRELDRTRGDVARRRARLEQAAQRKELVAEVLVDCPSGHRAGVELHYMVGGASWEPTYEARADEARGGVEWSTFATVRQGTGEDWSGVHITLSTAVPRQEATPPEITPLRLWAEERKAEKKVLVGRQEYREHAEASGAVEGGRGGEAPLRAAAQGLSVQLLVPEAADIPGDGTPSRLLVARDSMKAVFAWRTVPKLFPFAFRVADLVNRASFPLLAGSVDLFRNNAFLGRVQQERVAEGQKFHLTFGIEEGFKVKRKIIEETIRDKGFLGSTRRFRYAYRFEVGNFLAAPGETSQTLELSEPVPVSELDDVKVSIDPQVQKSAPVYEWNTDDGVVTWKLKLGRGEKKTFDFIYYVDVPSSYDSGGL